MPRTSTTIDLDDLAARVAPLVVAILTRALTTGTAAPYSTRKGAGPAGIGDRTWKRIARTIPGAQHVGRWIIVPRHVYDAWAARDVAPAPAANDAIAEPWSPARALASVGLRASGGRP